MIDFPLPTLIYSNGYFEQLSSSIIDFAVNERARWRPMNEICELA